MWNFQPTHTFQFMLESVFDTNIRHLEKEKKKLNEKSENFKPRIDTGVNVYWANIRL